MAKDRVGRETPWTESRVALLKELYDKGYSASRIARELNCGLTRNAVIGRLHRMSDYNRKAPPSVTLERPPAQGRKKRVRRRLNFGPPAETLFEPEVPLPPEKPLPFDRVGDFNFYAKDGCRFICGEIGADWSYCNAPRTSGSVF